MFALRARGSIPPAKRPATGFTLMEILVVVIIVGILAMIALPSYQESMRKGRRTDAKQALMSVASREEQYMLDHSTYTSNLKDLGFDVDDDEPMISEEKHYSIERVTADIAGEECDVDDATCYVLKATPLEDSPQIDDKRCDSFSLDSSGKQYATGTDKDNCWK